MSFIFSSAEPGPQLTWTAMNRCVQRVLLTQRVLADPTSAHLPHFKCQLQIEAPLPLSTVGE